MNLRAKFVFSIGLLGLLCLTLPGSLRANTILGTTIDVQNVWPSVDVVYQDLGTITVTSTPQTLTTFQPYFDVAISGTQIVLSDSNSYVIYGPPPAVGTFNGVYLVDESIAFPDTVIDSSSVLTGGSPIITIAGNTLEIDFDGESFQPGEQLVLDVGPSPTPEPGSGTLMLIGVGLLGLMMVMRKRIAQGLSQAI